MITMFVRHNVQDYANWRKAFDAFGDTAQKMGAKAAAVYRNVNDDLEITVSQQFDNMESASRFANSDELKSAMAGAGLAGPPDIWFTEEVT